MGIFINQAPRAMESSLFKKRREDLCALVRARYGETNTGGSIVLFAAIEMGSYSFVQDATFYYFTGVNEPGAILVIDIQSAHTTLLVPTYNIDRSRWVSSVITPSVEMAKQVGMDDVIALGAPLKGYAASLLFVREGYQNLLTLLSKVVENRGILVSTVPAVDIDEYRVQRYMIEQLGRFNELFSYDRWVDATDDIASLRRSKDMQEIEFLNHAIAITQDAFNKAVEGLIDGANEAQVHGMISYAMLSQDAQPAYPPIVAAGKNSTILHYHVNNGPIANGDLVLIDAGARYNHYCADITRTYPASGKFTATQRARYELVLATQEHVAQHAAPGMWLKNDTDHDRSLYHIAKKFLATQGDGADRYFLHGIGHFLGLEVHDVGNYRFPLQEGDVITIEPGIYIEEESLGIRIEDNYWIVKGGAVCLSEGIVKSVDGIESLMDEKKQYPLSDDGVSDDDLFNDFSFDESLIAH